MESRMLAPGRLVNASIAACFIGDTGGAPASAPASGSASPIGTVIAAENGSVWNISLSSPVKGSPFFDRTLVLLMVAVIVEPDGKVGIAVVPMLGPGA